MSVRLSPQSPVVRKVKALLWSNTASRQRNVLGPCHGPPGHNILFLSIVLETMWGVCEPRVLPPPRLSCSLECSASCREGWEEQLGKGGLPLPPNLVWKV